MVTIQLDVDGVLADWDSAFGHVVDAFGRYSRPADAYGSKEHCDPPEAYDKAWELLKQTPWWWTSLKPLVFGDEFSRISKLCRVAEVYFVTNRMHDTISPVEQTASWLRQHGIPHPSVICTPYKGTAAFLLNTDYSLEDRHENAVEIGYNTVKSYLLDRPYNQGLYSPELRVPTVAAFLDIVEKAP